MRCRTLSLRRPEAHSFSRTALASLALLASVALLAATNLAAPTAAAKESPRDLTKPPASRPAPDSAGETRSLLGGEFHFRAPEGWAESAKAARDDTAAYAWPHHDSMLAVQVLPADAKITAAAAGKIIQSLRATRQKNKEQIVKAPVVEKDPRFLLRIHEKFKTGENHEKTAEQLHLYRRVGPRVVMVTVNTSADSADDVKAALTAGEDVAASASYEKK